jgi:hypothetical protein
MQSKLEKSRTNIAKKTGAEQSLSMQIKLEQSRA